MPGRDAAFIDRYAPEIERIETYRRAQYGLWRERMKTAFIIAAGVLPFTLYLDIGRIFIWPNPNAPPQFVGNTFVAVTALWFWVMLPRWRYGWFYERTVIPWLANMFGLEKYDPKGRLGMEEMRPSLIVPPHNVYQGAGSFEGAHGGTVIRFCQAELGDRQEDKETGKTAYRTVFKGLLVLVSLQKRRINAHTILISEPQEGGWLRGPPPGLQRADMVDPVFERKYEVYTSDQIEARYLLDPVVIDRVSGLSAVFPAGVGLAYFQNSVFIMIPGVAFFPRTPPMKQETAEAVLTIRKQLEQILQLLEYLRALDPERAADEQGVKT